MLRWGMGFITNSHDSAIIEGDFHRVDNQAYMDSHTLSGLADSRGLDMALKIKNFMEEISDKFNKLGITLKESGYAYGDSVSCNIGGKSPEQQQVVV